jgi:hypothetical protein
LTRISTLGSILHSTRVEDNLIEDLPGYATHSLTTTKEEITTFATINMGLDLARAAWPGLKQVFSCSRKDASVFAPGRPTTAKLGPPERVSRQVLSQHPVNLLPVNCTGNQPQPEILPWIFSTRGHKPRLVVEFWPAAAAVHEDGPMHKSTCQQWLILEYQSRCRLLNATQIGGSVDQDVLLVVRVHDSYTGGWDWPQTTKCALQPMVNCLRPCEIPQAAHHNIPTNMRVPHEDIDPMPAKAGGLIQSEYRIFQLLHDKLVRGLGTPKARAKAEYPVNAAIDTSLSTATDQFRSTIQQKSVPR